jgi:lipopolysaccharide transport system permease protein
VRLTADATDATTPLPSAPAPHPEPPLTVVEARSHWSAADLREVWRFRELFYYLTLRDIKIRYKQTILGVGWSVFQPLATMLVFAVFIGWMGKAADGVENYLLFVLAGVLPWTFFSNAVTNAANSLIANERLVTKTYFPRVLLPASNVGAALFDFAIGLVLLAIWIAIAGPSPTWGLVLAPLAIALLSLTAFGFGTLLSALIATQRDFRYVLAFGVQLWMFATPCLYLPATALGPAAKQWLPLNPAYGLILNFRAAVLGEDLDWMALVISTAVGVLVTVVALVYFRRVDRTLADTL